MHSFLSALDALCCKNENNGTETKIFRDCTSRYLFLLYIFRMATALSNVGDFTRYLSQNAGNMIRFTASMYADGPWESYSGNVRIDENGDCYVSKSDGSVWTPSMASFYRSAEIIVRDSVPRELTPMAVVAQPAVAPVTAAPGQTTAQVERQTLFNVGTATMTTVGALVTASETEARRREEADRVAAMQRIEHNAEARDRERSAAAQREALYTAAAAERTRLQSAVDQFASESIARERAASEQRQTQQARLASLEQQLSAIQAQQTTQRLSQEQQHAQLLEALRGLSQRPIVASPEPIPRDDVGIPALPAHSAPMQVGTMLRDVVSALQTQRIDARTMDINDALFSQFPAPFHYVWVRDDSNCGHLLSALRKLERFVRLMNESSVQSFSLSLSDRLERRGSEAPITPADLGLIPALTALGNSWVAKILLAEFAVAVSDANGPYERAFLVLARSGLRPVSKDEAERLSNGGWARCAPFGMHVPPPPADPTPPQSNTRTRQAKAPAKSSVFPQPGKAKN